MEYSTKDDPRFGYRFVGTAVLSSIPIWIGLLVSGFWFKSAIGCLIVLAVTLPFALTVIALKWRFANCPECGRRIRLDWRQMGYRQGGEFEYRCPDCMTIWRTHVKPGGYTG